MVSLMTRAVVLTGVLSISGVNLAGDPGDLNPVHETSTFGEFTAGGLDETSDRIVLPSVPPQNVQNADQPQVTPISHAAAKPVSGEPPPFPTVTLTGFFQVDGAWFSQDSLNQATVGNIPDIVDFRRARLAATGQAAENVGYMVDFDFAFPGRPTFMDVYLDLQDLPFGTLRGGQWRQPFGMDALTGVKELWFLERALPLAMLPFRQTGIGLFDTAWDENLTWAVAGYKFPAGPFGGNFGDSGYGLSTRVTFNPLYDELYHDVIHAGFNYSLNNPSTGVIRYRTTPEIGFTLGDFNSTSVAVPFFVDTGLIPTDTINLLGAELAASFGSLTIQSEFITSLVSQTSGPSLAFPGAYVKAAYALTGEHHPYNRTQGVFTRIKPDDDFGRRGYGAWELVVRWSYLDLTDENIAGGRLHDLTFGLNWTLNLHTRVQFNYIHAMLDSAVRGDSDADILAVRAQVDF